MTKLKMRTVSQIIKMIAIESLTRIGIRKYNNFLDEGAGPWPFCVSFFSVIRE
jgi:hypothetical protein